jgi:hypothetical protein
MGIKNVDHEWNTNAKQNLKVSNIIGETVAMKSTGYNMKTRTKQALIYKPCKPTKIYNLLLSFANH